MNYPRGEVTDSEQALKMREPAPTFYKVKGVRYRTISNFMVEQKYKKNRKKKDMRDIEARIPAYFKNFIMKD